jgi:tRNA(Ile)-lysidine synthetase-like protein
LKIGLAVSGGADSTALLVLMAGLRKTIGFEAVVLHVDHGLRKDSPDDAAFVKKLAAEHDLEVFSLKTKVRRRKGESLEMAARRVRLGFFEKMTKRLDLDCIATGHHMNDVAETFIMRLARASGAAGLAGLKPVSQVNGITFIRPLLNIDSTAIRAFLKSNGISWREDSTNSDISILRNKVRHVILPFLKRELDPKIVEHICRSASYLRECAEEQCSATPPVPAVSSAACTLKKASPPVKRKYELNVWRSTGFEKTAENIGMLPAKAWMSEAALKGRTIEVRTWRDGDWMRPCGFAHRKKLQDIFVTAKTPPEMRRTLPIVADSNSGEILWIPGYRVSDSVKVVSAKSPSVELTLSAE